MNQPLLYICPLPLESPSHFPPHPTPLGSHRAPGLSSLLLFSNFHWLSILHMVMCMFPWYSMNPFISSWTSYLFLIVFFYIILTETSSSFTACMLLKALKGWSIYYYTVLTSLGLQSTAGTLAGWYFEMFYKKSIGHFSSLIFWNLFVWKEQRNAKQIMKINVFSVLC